MNTSFSFNRLCLLLRYDFTQSRRNILVSAAVVVGLYLLLVYRHFFGEVKSYTPGEVSVLCHGVFSTATLVGIILSTLMLQRKFTNPTSAPLYITLPASGFEKFCALLLDYALVLIGIRVLEFVCYTATMGLGAIFYSDLNWSLSFFDGGENLEAMARQVIAESLRHDYAAAGLGSVDVAAWVCSTSWGLATFLYFVCLNFHFKRNGILMSCLIMLLTYIVIVCVILPIGGMFLAGYLDHIYELGDEDFYNTVIPARQNVLQIISVLMWCSPVIPLLTGYRLYRLVLNKQVK